MERDEDILGPKVRLAKSLANGRKPLSRGLASLRTATARTSARTSASVHHVDGMDTVGPRGATALIMVCTQGRDIDAIRYLVRSGASVDFEAFDFNDSLSAADKARGRAGSGPTTPLIAACYEGQYTTPVTWFMLLLLYATKAGIL